MSKEYTNGDREKHSLKPNGRGIFGTLPSPEARIIQDHDQLVKYADACRTLNLSIVMTSGTFDLLHIGHAKYLEKAKSYGDILVVCVDSDEKVRQRKGKTRPVVPDTERVQMLAHLRSVDIITLKYPDEPRWDLIKKIAPDTLVVTKETYDDKTLQELANHCGRVVSLEPQATTSTSAQIRRLQVGWTSTIMKPVNELLDTYKTSDTLREKLNAILEKWRR